MISFKEAQEIVLSYARSFGKEKILLDDSLGRVLAEQIIADRDYPPFNRAMMDGYAIKFSDWKNNVRAFTIVETIYAGKFFDKKINEGECYKIMTGASVPFYADVIIRREDADENGNKVQFNNISISSGQNIAAKGQDLKSRELICSESLIIDTATIALLASVGKYEVMVECLPKVAIITTGDEVVSVGSSVADVQIRNSNSHLLKALLKKRNIVPISCHHIADDKNKLEEAVSKVIHADIIILNGGVSAGDADYVPEILKKLGAKEIFHKVAIKPGKPIWFGKFENGATVFALPGNPFSCMVTFELFIRSYLHKCFDLSGPKEMILPVCGSRQKKSSLDEFFPVKISGHPATLVPLHFNGSGDITAAMGADGIAQHPADSLVLQENDLVICKLL
ncbi:molybdopterin molybdotransferase MoeA [Ferruginibacter sp. SUN002]|uniref:molybdopterin molybdotransferase MoeA n=1 Tax=Ferruginibacter sp. SUN002 TaxID=2937789 RepID=UPI003D36B28A